MSDIQDGDLVYVARTPHACGLEYLGTVHRVGEVCRAIYSCEDCGWSCVGSFATVSGTTGFPVEWLEKLKGLSDEQKKDEQIVLRDEVTACTPIPIMYGTQRNP